MELFSLALLIQQVEQPGGFLADQVNTAHIVYVVDVVPGDSLGLVLLLNKHFSKQISFVTIIHPVKLVLVHLSTLNYQRSSMLSTSSVTKCYDNLLHSWTPKDEINDYELACNFGNQELFR